MFKSLLAFLVGAVLLATTSAFAQEEAGAVTRAPAPAWVAPLSAPIEAPASDSAPIRFLVFDEQLRFDVDGSHHYSLRRTRIQNRQGLGLVSTVNAVWSPGRERVEVHAVRIIRGDQVIDVLDGQAFEILRRESNLESSMLDGRLTATLQPRDLRVGDILETAFTIHDSGGVLAPHRESLTSAGNSLTIDTYRMRASWPTDIALRAAATDPWSDVRPRREGREWIFEIEARALSPELLPEDLPTRYGLTRIAQFTDFADWSDAAALMAPLYEEGAALEADSPLKAEIERIRAAHANDGDRAIAALGMVQDQVRYVATSIGEGGYVPVAADEVWRSRYGDCKGKTVLLLALLRGLGIDAEAALVSTQLGDGLNERMPLISWFDHVVVKAEVDGQTRWLDGTRTGDRVLAEVTPPPFHWALLAKENAALEPIERRPQMKPTMEMVFDADVTAGIDADIDFDVAIIYRGDTATAMRQSLSAVPADQLRTHMMASFNQDDSTATVSSADTRFDETDNSFHLLFKGKDRLSWVNGTGGRVMAVPETALSIPYAEERLGLYAAYQNEPYAIAFPYQARSVTRLVLPDQGRGFRLEGGDQTIEAGGFRMEREARLVDGVVEVIMTTTSLVPEVSASAMADARTRAESLSSSEIRIRAPATYAATEADRARLQPGDSDVADLLERARRLAETGDAPGAISLLDAAVQRDPDNGELLRARGRARLSNRDYAGARADYDAAVDLDPADGEAVVGQGLTAFRDGRFNDAIVSFTVALRLEPDNFTALAARGAAYHQIGRWDRALADYRALKLAAPASPTGLFGELRALERLGRSEEARTLIDAKLAETPVDTTALTALTSLGRKNGRPQDALPALDAAVAAAPDDLSLLTLRAEARIAAGDADGARTDYHAFRERGVADPMLMNNLCWSQGVAGFDLDRALEDCDRAMESGEAAVIDSRAMVLLHLGRYDEAKSAYDQALAAAPDLTPSLYGRGLARLALGDAEGRADLERAQALDVDAADDFEAFLKAHPDLRP